MRAEIKAEIKGLNKVRKNFQKFGKQGQDAFRGAMYAEGLLVIGKATENAPAVTGRLRNSHFATLPDRKGSLVIGFGVKYAAAVEYGITLLSVSRRQQKAAFALMRKYNLHKSKVGGPAFFRKAINATTVGRVARIAATTKRYFEQGRGVQIGDIPQQPETR